MQGSFAPVEAEVHSQELEVLEGALPEGLEGAYVRTGGCAALRAPVPASLLRVWSGAR
jgi:carotenoid cleavage dioxygenase-like enzyme